MTLTHYLLFSPFNDIYLYQKLTKKKEHCKISIFIKYKKKLCETNNQQGVL